MFHFFEKGLRHPGTVHMNVFGRVLVDEELVVATAPVVVVAAALPVVVLVLVVGLPTTVGAIAEAVIGDGNAGREDEVEEDEVVDVLVVVAVAVVSVPVGLTVGVTALVFVVVVVVDAFVDVVGGGGVVVVLVVLVRVVADDDVVVVGEFGSEGEGEGSDGAAMGVTCGCCGRSRATTTRWAFGRTTDGGDRGGGGGGGGCGCEGRREDDIVYMYEDDKWTVGFWGREMGNEEERRKKGGVGEMKGEREGEREGE